MGICVVVHRNHASSVAVWVHAILKLLAKQSVRLGWGLQSRKSYVECAGLTGHMLGSVGGSIEMVVSGKEAVDSGFKRCKIRLPLTRIGKMIEGVSG